MRHYRTFIVALFAALFFSVGEDARSDESIIVAAQETTATVSPRTAREKLVSLPGLEFSLRAVFKCKGEPVSVTLSIADTFLTIKGEVLAGQRAAETTLEVPPRQLALAASSNFCLEDDPESSDELLVPGFATAHVSLRCQAENKASAHFGSAPLQVRLSCERDAAQTPSAADESR